MYTDIHISINGISKKFNNEWIFKGISYEINPGDFIAITGPNGSGKTTLLQIIAGFIPASEGNVIFFEKDHLIETSKVYQYLSIAATYQEVIEDFTLLEFLDFHFKFKNIIQGHTFKTIAKEVLPKQSHNKPIKFFSSGMKQRVKLASAFYTNVPIIFLDEPTSNLDSNGFKWYEELLEKALNEKKIIILASNQPAEFKNCTNFIDIDQYRK